MAASQPYTVACSGGLVKSSNSIDLLKSPGVARELRNFEVSIEGGYRRINGFAKFGGASSVQPTGSADTILGVTPYADGVIACASTNIYFSQDGITWVTINKLSAGGGDDYATFTGKSVTARTGQGQISFAMFEGAGQDYGEIIIADGANKPFSFRMEGTGALSSRTFFTEEITVTGTKGVTHVTSHDHHLIAAGVEDNENTVYYSVYNNPNDFTGAGAGSVTISDKIVGIRGFREDLIVFCENSLHKLVNINDSNNIRIDPIAENVGCLSGYSIQEIGGDLIFLAPDGLRTVAGTARIGDVELGTVSKAIQPLVTDLANSINTYTISSMVHRDKSQYKLFYTDTTVTESQQRGIVGTLRPNGFEWSETRGIEVTAIGAGFNEVGVEIHYHGSTGGYVYIHDSGNDFDGTDIFSLFQTPFFHMQDPEQRKIFYTVATYLRSEGDNSIVMSAVYDYEDVDVLSPSNFTLTTTGAAAYYNEATYNSTAIFDGNPSPVQRTNISGSGKSASFRYVTNDSNASHSVQGLVITFGVGDRL